MEAIDKLVRETVADIALSVGYFDHERKYVESILRARFGPIVEAAERTATMLDDAGYHNAADVLRRALRGEGDV